MERGGSESGPRSHRCGLPPRLMSTQLLLYTGAQPPHGNPARSAPHLTTLHEPWSDPASYHQPHLGRIVMPALTSDRAIVLTPKPNCSAMTPVLSPAS